MKHLVLFIAFCFVVSHYGSTAGEFVIPGSCTNVVCELGSGDGKFVDPDACRNVSELITCKGYPVEEHTLVTSDGYILSIQRIPHGINKTGGGSKGVFLFVHGEVGDSKTWFLNPPGQGLGYIIPDEGYDAWFLNNRGCDYSKKHVRYPTRSLKFWDFSFDEMAQYDLPETIDYILKVTGKDYLYSAGYSRGNTVMFAMLSQFPEYNKKVKLYGALAPIAYIGHFTTAIRYFIPFTIPIALGATALTQGEFIPYNTFTRIFVAKFCELQDAELCSNLLFAIAGQNKAQLNMTRVPIYTAQYPSSTSVKSLVHFSQLYKSKKFRKYDYGRVGNLLKYRQAQPPDYQVSRITAPLALFWSMNDKIADPTDVGILRSQLRSVVLDYKVPGDQYNHFDFIWAINSPELIYKPLLEKLDELNSTN